MPVPGVPTLDPVNKPTLSPAEAGRGGDAVAQLGQLSNDAAATGLQLDLYIKRAQQSVDEVAFQNQANAAVMQYQDALAKTTNSRDVDDVTKQAQDNLNSIVKQWGKSPAAISIQQQADGLMPKLDHLGQVRGIDLMGKEWDAQTDIQMQTLLPQLVTAQRNGDKAQVDYINGYIDHIFENGKKSGLITDTDKEVALNKVQIQLRKQLNDASISSADPKERLAAIQQLKTGGSGPLNLEGLAPGDVAALRTEAESKNNQLDNLAEAQNLNRDLNTVQNAFAAPEYKNNYEARINSLQDGDWLKQHGIVSEDGSPNREMAEKLIAETNRQRAEWEKETADRDDKAATKISPLIDENKLSLGQLTSILDQTEGISPKVRAQLVEKWRANTNENIRLRNESYEVAQQMKAQKSQEVAADFNIKIANGAIPSEADVLTAPGLSKADQTTVLDRAQKARADKPYQGGLTIISSAYPETNKMTPAQKGQQQEYYLRTMQAYDQEINAHPDEDKSAIAAKLVMPGIVRDAILNSVPGFVAPRTPSLWERFTGAATTVQNFMEGKTPPTASAGSPSLSAPAPKKVGDTKKFPNGKTGVWDGTGYVAQ